MVCFSLGFLLGAECLTVLADKLVIQIEPEWDGKPLVLARSVEAKSAGFSLSRVDGLLSELELQRSDGTWLPAREWYAFFSLGKGRLTASADGLPAEEFIAIRFRVGLREEIDRVDAQRWDYDHALHPDGNGLHWGWSSGYVFLALEGHFEKADQVSGFSYHLAGAGAPMRVEVPVRFSGKQSNTVRVAFDVAKVLDLGAVVHESQSTHSRDGDLLALKLKERASRAFRLVSVTPDIFQEITEVVSAAEKRGVGTPYVLPVSQRLPKVKLPADNPLTVEGVALGRELFHDARLSKGNLQSCASCHDSSRAFTDGRAYSVGASGVSGRRNAMPLMNLAWADGFFWDGRAKTLREQVLMPIQDVHEMNEQLSAVTAKLAKDDGYRAKFKAAFGSEEINSDRLAMALEQFLLTLVSQDSKFDRAARKAGELSAQEKRGLELFVTEFDPARGLRGADCFHCHGGNLFTNHDFINNGLEERGVDRGRVEVTGNEADRNKFKVPTLRNVAVSGPYMHDGRFATLAEVVEHYNGGVVRSRTLDPNLAKHPQGGLGLSEADKAALVAFLETLTDEKFTGGDLKQFSKTK